MRITEGRNDPSKLRNSWLDATDPANIKGYWVPSPDEIEMRQKQFRETHLKGSQFGFPSTAKAFDSIDYATPVRKLLIKDDYPRCDCPYWGTEFEALP